MRQNLEGGGAAGVAQRAGLGDIPQTIPRAAPGSWAGWGGQWEGGSLLTHFYSDPFSEAHLLHL